MASESKLFQPLQVGNMKLSSRLVMAPLTRFRADDEHVQLPMVKDYYAQRACVPGTFIITEATPISPRASGYNNIPHISTEAQIKAWKEITDAVHAKGGYIFMQMWNLGRAADPEVLKKDGLDLVSSSDIPMSDNSPKPRPLTEEEIQQFIKDYANTAKVAVEQAGFDGVEIHGANGYLIDQFTQNNSNKRTDKWGGSVENRSRFALEVVKAVVAAVGPERTGIRLSPWSPWQGMKMEYDDVIAQFTHLISGIKEYELAYLHLVESRVGGIADVEATEKVDFAIDIWGKTSPIFLAGGFRPDSARSDVDGKYADKDIAIVFGRYFISTPDLVFRVRKGIELNPYDRDSFYDAKNPKGYIDYPFSAEFKREANL